jgi:hypothetical protein
MQESKAAYFPNYYSYSQYYFNAYYGTGTAPYYYAAIAYYYYYLAGYYGDYFG